MRRWPIRRWEEKMRAGYIVVVSLLMILGSFLAT